MPKVVRKRQNTVLRRKQIINTLGKLIIQYGSENVTVRRLAEAIGVTGGAIYRHFKSKKEILLFLVDHIEENLIGETEKRYLAQKPLVFLEKILKDHLSSIEQRRGVSFLVIAEIISLGDRRLNRKIFEVLNKYLGLIKGIVSKGIESGEIREDLNPDTAAKIFFGMIQGLVTIWYLGNYNFVLEEEKESMWDIFCEAVKRRPA
jgi:AcrR family transcriptional regulator